MTIARFNQKKEKKKWKNNVQDESIMLNVVYFHESWYA